MRANKNNNNFDKLIYQTVGREKPKLDFDKWKERHQKEIGIYESQITEKHGLYSDHPFNVWRAIMKSPIPKLAAGVVIIMVIIGLHQFNHSISGTSVVWADVAKRLEQMHSYKARMRRVFTEVGKKEPYIECDALSYFSPDHGYMEKQYINYMEGQDMNGVLGMTGYGLFSEKVLIIVLPHAKQYYRFEINEEIMSVIEYVNPVNPDGMMKLFGSERCTRLGKRKINNIDAEGFEVKGIKVLSGAPRFLFKFDEGIDVRVWVDPDSLLPIEVELEGLIGKGLLTGFRDLRGKSVTYDIEYDPEIDESIFEPNIPDDYTLIDPAKIAKKAEMSLLGIVPFGAAIIVYKRIKKMEWNKTQ